MPSPYVNALIADVDSSFEGWRQALIARLEDSHQRLKAALGQLCDEQLLGYPVPELRRTLLEIILSSGTAHECHRGGQISYLGGLQAQWGPLQEPSRLWAAVHREITG